MSNSALIALPISTGMSHSGTFQGLMEILNERKDQLPEESTEMQTIFQESEIITIQGQSRSSKKTTKPLICSFPIWRGH